MKLRMFVVVVLFVIKPIVGLAQESPETPSDQEVIRKTVEAYVAAFNKADAKALAAMWSPEAVYTNPLNGDLLIGREAIEKQFAANFAEIKELKLEATTDSVQLISPGVAVEHGSAKLLQGDQTIEESKTTSIFVKRDGVWLLDRVTEEAVVEPVSHYDQLKDLEWMLGKWIDRDEIATVATECNWSRNKNFLIRSFTVEIDDRIDMSGIQIIGWNPREKKILSWVFDSDGGFGQGTWSKKGSRWFVQQTGVLPDGGMTSATNIISYIDDKTCTLQSVNRTVDGELVPSIDEVVITKE